MDNRSWRCLARSTVAVLVLGGAQLVARRGWGKGWQVSATGAGGVVTEPMGAEAIIEREVRDVVRQRRIHPTADGQTLRRVVEDVVADYDERRLLAVMPPLLDPVSTAKSVADRIAGAGPLQPYLDDPQIEEIWINGPGKVFVARGGEPLLTTAVMSEQQVHDVVEVLLRASGRRVDLSSPFVDATLADGSRLHVAIPDITRQWWAVNIRKFVVRTHALKELVRLGSLSAGAARVLEAAVVAGLNIVVAGATQAGKTTMLSCLAAAIPPRERVVTCEEVFELHIGLPDVVNLQTRPANLEGQGEIGQRRLIKEALRMRPDRLLVGEVRQEECLDLLIALNSGLPGMTSIHANSAREALSKLTTLPLLAGPNVSFPFILLTVAATVDLVVFLRANRSGRRVEEVLAVHGAVEGDHIAASPVLLRSDGALVWTGEPLPHPERFTAVGIDPIEVLAHV